METVLLSPNKATPNTASQQSGVAIEGEDSGGFSPAMDEAISSLDKGNEQNDSFAGDNADKSTDTFPNDDSVNPESISSANTLINTDDTTMASVGSANTLISTDDTTIASIVSPNTLISTNDTTIASIEKRFAAVPHNNILQVQVPHQASNSFTIEGMTTTAISQQESSPPVIPAGTENNLPSTTKAETLLLQQIQQILDQGKNNGSITINGSALSAADSQRGGENLQNLSNPLLADSQNSAIQARQVGIIPLSPENTVRNTQNSVKLEGVQQDVNEQFYNAKFGESKGQNSAGFQQSNNDQKGTEQQNKSEVDVQNTLNQTSGSTVSEGKLGDSAFGQQLSTSSVTSPPPTSIEGKLAPGVHLPVPEKEILNNLIQRFSVNPRLQTSKLTMRLHPVELGALKIDILVKGDSIKTNIVAQSQQVLETLEKQMPRLRAVLQEQGFTVDSFVISLDSDGGNQKELFQEQFSSSQQEFTSGKSLTQDNDSFDILLDSQKETNETHVGTSGVNLQA